MALTADDRGYEMGTDTTDISSVVLSGESNSRGSDIINNKPVIMQKRRTA
jgi:hypothetical protein